MRKPRSLGLAIGVVSGGVVLGSLLGAAADPKMKNLPGSDWTPPVASAAEPSEGVSVYELAAYPERYAPPFPDEAITDWAPDYPAWTYSDFGSDVVDPVAEEPAEPEPPRVPEGRALPAEPRIAGSLDAIY